MINPTSNDPVPAVLLIVGPDRIVLNELDLVTLSSLNIVGSKVISSSTALTSLVPGFILATKSIVCPTEADISD